MPAPCWLRASDRQAPHHDGGLQAERTAMSWQRTALGVGVVSALLLRETGGRLPAAVPGLFGLVVATILFVLSEVRYEFTRDGSRPHLAARHLVRLLSVSVVILAVLAIGLILVEGKL